MKTVRISSHQELCQEAMGSSFLGISPEPTKEENIGFHPALPPVAAP